MSIIGGSGIIPSGGGIAPPPSGSGALQEPSFDVNYAYGDGDWELEGSELDIQIYLRNSADAPLGVTLSFSDNILEAVNFDSGSASSPSFVVPPTGGGANTQRVVTLQRGSGAPSLGNPSLDCSVSFTLADGSTSPFTQQITVHPVTLVKSVIGSIATPTIQYLFEDMTNSGSGGSSYDLIASASNFTVQADTSAQGFTGSASTASGGTTGHLKADLQVSDYFNTGVARTWIWAVTSYEPSGGSTGRQFMATDWDAYGGAVSFRHDSTWVDLSFHNSSGSRVDWAIDNTGTAKHYDVNGVQDGDASSGVTPQGLSDARNHTGATMILAVTFDPSLTQFKLLCKWSDDNPGFSGKDFSTTVKSLPSASSLFGIASYGLIGHMYATSPNAHMAWRYFGVIDSMITPVDFKNILQVAGMLS